MIKNCKFRYINKVFLLHVILQKDMCPTVKLIIIILYYPSKNVNKGQGNLREEKLQSLVKYSIKL